MYVGIQGQANDNHLKSWPTLTFINLDGDSRLVIRGCREDLGFLCGHHGVPGDQLGHYSSNSLNTKGQGAHIQKNHITCKTGNRSVNRTKLESSFKWKRCDVQGRWLTSVLLSRKHSSLHSSSVCNSLIRVDAPGGLFAIEELLHQLLDFGDTGGASNQDNLINVGLLQVRVFQHLLHWLHGGTEQVLTKQKEKIKRLVKY